MLTEEKLRYFYDKNTMINVEDNKKLTDKEKKNNLLYSDGTLVLRMTNFHSK